MINFYSISDTHSNVKSVLIEILSSRFHWIPALIRSFIFPLLWPCYVCAFKLQMSTLIYCRQTIKTNPEQKFAKFKFYSEKNAFNSWPVFSLFWQHIFIFISFNSGLESSKYPGLWKFFFKMYQIGYNIENAPASCNQ